MTPKLIITFAFCNCIILILLPFCIADVKKAQCVPTFEILKNVSQCYRQITGREYEMGSEDEVIEDQQKYEIYQCTDKMAGVVDENGHYLEDIGMQILEEHVYFDAEGHIIKHMKETLHDCYIEHGDEYLKMYDCFDEEFSKVCDIFI